MMSNLCLRLLPAVLFLSMFPPFAAGDEPAPEPPTLEDVLDRMKDSERARKLSGVVDASEVQDKAVTTLLIKYLKDKDFQIRMAAIESLRTRRDNAEKRRAAQALCARLKPLSGKTGEEEEYSGIISVLHDLAQPTSIKALIDMDLDEPLESAEARLLAIGNIPCADAIESLIDFMARGRRKNFNRQRQFAAKALQYATGEKRGQDPDDWRGWWKDAKARFDFEAAAQSRRDEENAAEEKRRRAEERAAEREERLKERERKQAEREREGGGKPRPDGEGNGDE